jgi:hypothetical protein
LIIETKSKEEPEMFQMPLFSSFDLVSKEEMNPKKGENCDT